MNKVISTLNLPEGATMAHVMVELGVFPSVTQARKNGWDKPITLGSHLLTKKKIAVEIIDTPIEVSEKPFRWDLEPGFWPSYREPPSNVARAIEYPLSDPHWVDRMVAAFAKDAALARKGKSDAIS